MPFTQLSPEDAATAPPARFTFVSEGEDVKTFASDTLTGIVEALIPGYDALPEPDDDGFDEHLDARIGALSAIAGVFQAGALASMEEDGVDLNLTDDQLTALLHPKDQEPLEFDVWESPVPLMLLATQYVPYTDVVPPEGDTILWLNAHNERTFLEAIVHLGIGTLFVNDQVETPALDESF